ncbi:MAG: ATP-dependent DNA helicase RecG [Candidatus Omnitrophica bacterium CG1_02_49_10]|nr:MAG: ATP-dependent DNA helicase RecG [Candidatus Omnitrophica bacterium CG1_02_49_10]
MKIDDVHKSVRFIKGVGPGRAQLLARLGIYNISDMLFCYPRRHEDRSRIRPISEVKAAGVETIEAAVTATGLLRSRRGQSMLKVRISDGTGRMNIVFFNQPYLKNYLKKGVRAVFYGRVDNFKGLQMNNPEFEIMGEEEHDSVHTGRIVPVYPLTAGLGQRWLRNLIYGVIEDYSAYLKETLPTSIRARNKLLGYGDAVKNMHFPKSEYMMKESRRRLVFDEFVFMQLFIGLKRHHIRENSPGVKHSVKEDFVSSFLGSMPFELTKGQRKAMAEVSKDMASSKPMARLLQGDVGSGKTAVAAYAMALSAHNGMQAALMAPTEILADQHFITISQFLSPMGFRIELLTGGVKDKESVCEKISSGEADMIVGTHALIADTVRFKNLGLAVVDEEHKFGVIQREALLSKVPKRPDMLIMTATPIPRTLALTIYGEFDISTLSDMPKGKRSVITYWFDPSRRSEIYDFVKARLKEGKQAFIISPLIDSAKRADISGAENIYSRLKNDIFSGYAIKLLHGKMPKGAQDAAMKAFRDKEADLLVATTIVEVGIDVPNATIMVIDHAERFGLAQLHQLRGRIGRSAGESYCILISDAESNSAGERLGSMIASQDGFYISEKDMEIRGPGRLFGVRQHGFGELKLADLTNDLEILKKARDEAFRIVGSDPGLDKEEHRNIRSAMDRRFRYGHEGGGAG